MKKFIVSVAIMIATCVTSYAQMASGSQDLTFKGGKFYQNGIEVAAEQLPTIFGQETYDNQYIPAKKMRTAGVACLSAGCPVAAIGAGLIIAGAIDGNSTNGSAHGGMVMVGTGIITASCGVIAAVTGGILLGSANKRMKNLRPASSGAGIALAF